MEKKSSEVRKRQEVIRVRVTTEEETMIEEKAKSCSMTEAAFLRKLAAGFTPRSTLDQQAIDQLARIIGEQGKLGGLLKIAIMELQGHRNSQAIISEIEQLIAQIRKSQATLKELVIRLRG